MDRICPVADHDEDDEDELSDADKPKKRPKKRRKQTAKQREATLKNLRKARAAVGQRQKASGKPKRRRSRNRVHRKATRRARRKSPTVAVASQTFAGGGNLTSLSLDVPGFTPVPTLPGLGPVAAGTAGARPPVMNGSTLNGRPLLPRNTDGNIVNIRSLAFATRLA